MMHNRAAVVVALMFALALSSVRLVTADRGFIPIDTTDENIYVVGPYQEAIVAFNGSEELLILKTGLRTNSEAPVRVLEFLPLPSLPENILLKDTSVFSRVYDTLWEHAPPYPENWYTVAPTDRKGWEVVFNVELGPHNLHVVRVETADNFIAEVDDFLGTLGVAKRAAPEKLGEVVDHYLNNGMNYFVFDVVTLDKDPRGIAPIGYTFKTKYFYYPAVTSSLAAGNTEIVIYAITEKKLSIGRQRFDEPPEPHLAYWYGYLNENYRIEHSISNESLRRIDNDIADMFSGTVWLAKMYYGGPTEYLYDDIILLTSAERPEFDVSVLLIPSAILLGIGTCMSVYVYKRYSKYFVTAA
jgi:hypothetical protein